VYSDVGKICHNCGEWKNTVGHRCFIGLIPATTMKRRGRTKAQFSGHDEIEIEIKLKRIRGGKNTGFSSSNTFFY